MGEVTFKNVWKAYEDENWVIREFNATIGDGQFCVLLGPSGCGKSTILRMIAGLEPISRGEILIDGELVNEVAPKNRDIAMVFQNYALYPHKTVFKNMEYPLKLKKLSKEERRKKVHEAAEVLEITNLLDKYPRQLSGGQKQRAAVGRALVRQPRVYLFDEPLSNLDAKLRAAMRSEIKLLHRKFGITFIYVTHDQVEAMTMADRIILLKDGAVQQDGTPDDLYSRPRTVFTGSFIGSPPMNFFTIRGSDPSLGSYRLPEGLFEGSDPVLAGIRPEHLFFEDDGKGHKVEARFVLEEMIGREFQYSLDVPGYELGSEHLMVLSETHLEREEGDAVQVYFHPENLRFFSGGDGKVIEG